MTDYLPAIAILILTITGLIETFLSATWNKMYFNSGILVIMKNVQVDIHHSNIPDCSLFENEFKSGCFSFTRSLIFEKLDSHVYGFRERLFPLKRISLLHGLLIFDDENDQVVVKGFLDWTALCFSLIWVILPLLAIPLRDLISSSKSIWLVVLVYFGILMAGLGIFYSIDYSRFSAVAEFAAQSWSRKYVNAGQG